MKKKIFIGAVLFFHTETHITVESFMCIGSNRSEAETRGEHYALTFARRNNLKYEKLLYVVKEQNPNEIRQTLDFAQYGEASGIRQKRIGLKRDKIEVKLNGNVLFI